MDEARVSQLAAKAKGLRASHVQGVNGLEGKVGMLQLEVTRGQIGAGDLTRVFQKAKEIGARSYALGAFVVSHFCALDKDTHERWYTKTR